MIGLRAGLTHCIVDGQVILLDLPADRYFAFPPAGAVAFQSAEASDVCPTQSAQSIERPCEVGLVDDGSGAFMATLPRVSPAS
jgi:hypothetical protein